MYKRGVFGKKAIQVSLWTLIEILILVAIIAAGFSFVKSVKESRFFERSALSKDTALLMDALQSVPGDVFFTYRHEGIDTTRYDFVYDKYSIEIQEPDSSSKTFYPYYDDTFLANSYSTIKQPTKIPYLKTCEGLQIRADLSPAFNICCGSADKSLEGIKQVYIVFDDKTPQIKTAAETLANVLQLPKRIDSFLYPLSKAIENSGGEISGGEISGTFPDSTIFSQKTAPIITLTTGTDKSGTTGTTGTAHAVVISYNDIESRKLACYIANEFRGSTLLPDGVGLQENKKEILLPAGHIGVFIEIGSKNAQGFELNGIVSDAGKLIAQGIKKYEDSRNA